MAGGSARWSSLPAGRSRWGAEPYSSSKRMGASFERSTGARRRSASPPTAGTTWREGRVTVWDVKSGEEVGAWRAEEGLANGVAFSRDGRALATAGSDGAVCLWEVATRRRLAVLRHEGEACQPAFSPDGATLATTGIADRLGKLWDVSFLRSLKGHRKATNSQGRGRASGAAADASPLALPSSPTLYPFPTVDVPDRELQLRRREAEALLADSRPKK